MEQVGEPRFVEQSVAAAAVSPACRRGEDRIASHWSCSGAKTLLGEASGRGPSENAKYARSGFT